MPYAISLLLDGVAADRIQQLWLKLSRAGLSHSMSDLGYPPHLTLCVYDELDIESAAANLTIVCKKLRPVEVCFETLGTFEHGAGVVYATPADTGHVTAIHVSICRAINATCVPHYQPGRWRPHCTLATSLSDTKVAQAMTLLSEGWRDVRGRFETLELVRFAPVERIQRWELDPSQGR